MLTIKNCRVSSVIKILDRILRDIGRREENRVELVRE